MTPYQIRTFRGGISDEADKGIAGSFKHGYSLDIHKRNDSLTCQQAMAVSLSSSIGTGAYSTTMVSHFNCFIPASDGSLYAFGNTGSIFCRSGEGVWNFVYNDPNGKIIGAAEWQTSDDANYLFWATQSALARKPFPGVTVGPDTGMGRWTDASHDYKVEFVNSTAAWHVLKPIAGALYMGNNESLAQFDFDGNWDPGITNLRPHNSITCLEERDDYVVMG